MQVYLILKKYGWNMDRIPILPGVKDGPGFGRKALSGAAVGSDGGQKKGASSTIFISETIS
jgi:hypothetical protein